MSGKNTKPSATAAKAFIKLLVALQKEAFDSKKSFYQFLGIPERTYHSWTAGGKYPSQESMDKIRETAEMEKYKCDRLSAALENFLTV